MMPHAAFAVLVLAAWSLGVADSETTTATTTIWDPVKIAEESVSANVILERLRSEQAAMRGLEQAVRGTQNMLATSEGAFARTAHEVALREEDLRNLSSSTLANAGVLSKLNEAISTDGVFMQATGNELGLLSNQANENEKKADNMARMVKQLDSMGDIKNKGGGCLDAVDRQRHGSELQMWECLKDRESQEWALDLKTGRLKNLDGICLAAPDPSAIGGSVMMWSCDPSSASQKWTYDEDTLALKTSSNLCLSAPTPAVKGSALALASCDSSESQQWDMVPGSTGLRKRLVDLNAHMWNLQNPGSSESIESQGQAVSDLETGVSGFMHQLTQKARVVLTNRLRHRANNLRHALNRLGDAGWGGQSEGMLVAPEQVEDAPEAFGADLGLAAAAAAAAAA